MPLQAIIFHMSYGKKSIATGASAPAAQRHSTFAQFHSWKSHAQFAMRDMVKSWKSQAHQLLLGGFNHLEKYESMGRIIPYIMEHKKSVPNHQPDWNLKGLKVGSTCHCSPPVMENIVMAAMENIWKHGIFHMTHRAIENPLFVDDSWWLAQGRCIFAPHAEHVRDLCKCSRTLSDRCGYYIYIYVICIDVDNIENIYIIIYIIYNCIYIYK